MKTSLFKLNSYLRHGALKWSVKLIWRTSVATFLCFTCDVWRDTVEVWGTICKRQQCKLSRNWKNQHETNEDQPKYLISSKRGHVFKNVVKLVWLLFVFWCKLLTFIFSHHSFKKKITGGLNSYVSFLDQLVLFHAQILILTQLAWGCHSDPGGRGGGHVTRPGLIFV